MAKKIYAKPQAITSEFVANEYVTTCNYWKIGCNVCNESSYTGKYGNETVWYNRVNGRNDGGHRPNYCGDPNKQEIVLNADGSISIKENSANAGSVSLGTLYTNSSYTTKATLTKDDIQANTTVYWVNSIGTTKWYHYGTPSDFHSDNHS